MATAARCGLGAGSSSAGVPVSNASCALLVSCRYAFGSGDRDCPLSVERDTGRT